MPAIRLIVGLGNPGERYRLTRHNVGAECVLALSDRFRIALKPEAKFKGRLGRGPILGHDVRLLLPGYPAVIESVQGARQLLPLSR